MALDPVFVNLIQYAPYPNTTIVQDSLTAWAASEGTPVDINNPLATTYQLYPNQPVYNSAGVGIYATPFDGARAIIGTLATSLYGYPAIVAALKSGNDFVAIYEAVNASSWCAGCEGGNYPVALFEIIQGQVPPGIGGGGGGAAPPPPPIAVAPPFTFGLSPQDQVMINWWAQLYEWVAAIAPQIQQQLQDITSAFQNI